MKVTISESDKVTVKGIGILVGTVEYSPGYPGSWDQPPEPPELESIQLRDASGAGVPDFVWEESGTYYALCEAVWPLIESDLDKAEPVVEDREVFLEPPF